MQNDNRIFAENLKILNERQGDLDLIRRGVYRELIRLSRKGADLPRDAAGIYEAAFGEGELCTMEFARFCLEFADLQKRRLSVKELLAGEEPEPPMDPGKTAYLKNSYTDRAYRIFSEKIKGLTAAYYSGYGAACEEVYYGRSTYVILPLYNTMDGRLVSFRRMLTKYDLKIAASCTLEMDEDATVQYVLAKKGLSWESGSPLFFDVAVVLPEGVSTGTFFHAAELFGMKPLLINAIPLEYVTATTERHELDIQFQTTEASEFAAFLLFLEASRIRYSAEGIYRNYSE